MVTSRAVVGSSAMSSAGAGQGHGDHDALLHAAGHLVGVFGEAACGFGDADAVEGVRGDRGPGFWRHLVEEDGLDDLAADGENGVEGGHGFLEDHGDLAAADGLHVVFGELEEVLALEKDAAARSWAAGSGGGE